MDPRVIDAGERRALDCFARSWRKNRPADVFPGPVVWDVGANVGDYAREVLDRLPHARLFAFEPQRGAHAQLEQYLDSRAADVDGSVAAFNCGLSDEECVADLHKANHVASYHASIYERSSELAGIAIDTTEQARFFKGYDIARAYGVTQIDWLKIDVEGHELAVLDGLDTFIWPPETGVIQFEYNSAAVEQGIPFRDFWNKLAPAYELIRLDEDGSARWVIDYEDWSEEGDGQRNYLAVCHDCDWFEFPPVDMA